MVTEACDPSTEETETSDDWGSLTHKPMSLLLSQATCGGGDGHRHRHWWFLRNNKTDLWLSHAYTIMQQKCTYIHHTQQK